VKHVRTRRSRRVHYWTTRWWYGRTAEGEWVRRSAEGLLCWTPGGGIHTTRVDDTDDPVDCPNCLAKKAAHDRREAEREP